MFGQVCDTTGCRARPIVRVRREWALRTKTGAKVLNEDRELCGGPECLQLWEDRLLEPGTIAASREPLP